MKCECHECDQYNIIIRSIRIKFASFALYLWPPEPNLPNLKRSQSLKPELSGVVFVAEENGVF